MADDDRSVETCFEDGFVDRLGDDRKALLRQRGRAAVAGQLERDRTVTGGERVQDGIPHVAVERQPVKEHERRAGRPLVTLRPAGKAGPAGRWFLKCSAHGFGSQFVLSGRDEGDSDQDRRARAGGHR
jgi:hypothetical protein